MNKTIEIEYRLKAEFPELKTGLDETERKLLVYYALADGDVVLSDILKLKLCRSAAERDAVLDDLHKKGWLELDWRTRRNQFVLSDDHYVEVLMDALLYRRGLVELIDNHIKLHNKSDRRKIVEAVFRNEQGSVARLVRMSYYRINLDFLAPVIGRDSFSAAFKGLDDFMKKRLADIYMGQWLMREPHTVEGLMVLKRFAEDMVEDTNYKARTRGMADAYRFFLDGTLPEKIAGVTSEWTYGVEAVRALYKGKYTWALALFEDYLKIRNKNSRVKNIADSPIMSYALIMCYLLENSAKSAKKLEQFRNKKLEGRDYDNQMPGLFLARVSDGMEESTMKSISARIIESKDTDLFSKNLVAGVAASRGGRPDFSNLSDFAITRYETSAYNGIDPKEKEALAKVFGGSPLVERIHINEPWEALIESLGKSLGDDVQPDVAEQKQRRIIYVTRYGDTLKGKLQTITKSGKWSSGRELPLSSLKSGMYDDALEDVDRRIIDLSRQDIYMVDAFPLLVGSDRVFYENYDEASRIEIREELPYLTLDENKSTHRYMFSTNVMLVTYDSRYLPVTVIRKTVREYSVIRLNQAQIRLLTQIRVSGAGFPESAREALVQLLPRIGKVIEVHSPLLDSGSTLQDRDGNPMLYLRVVPHGQMFAASLFVRPLDNGKCTFWPGEGASDIFDSDDSGRYHVSRDLKKEKENLNAFLPKAGLDEESADEGMFELEPCGLLPAVQAAREMPESVTVEWPEGRSLKLAGSLTAGDFHVNVHSRENWFEMEGNAVSSDGKQFTLDQILAAIGAGGYDRGFLKLGEDEYVSLSDSLAKYMKRLEAMTSGSRGRVSVFQTGLLADVLDKSKVDAHVDEKVDETLSKMKESAALEPAVPAALKAELRDYQEEGFRWMVRLDHWGAGACLADDMGLGKTVQTIAFLLYKAKDGASMVVAPTSVLMNWKNELQRFAPSLDVVIFNDAADRRTALDGIGAYSIVLTTYGLLAKEQELLSAVDWNVVCLDEAHTIKNRDTKMSGAAMALKASSRIILTGTPVQNYLGELWNLFQFINPGLLGSYDNFNRKFIAPVEQMHDKEKQSQLKRIIQPFMLRRTKSEVVEELPEKTEIMRSVPLTPAETVAYETMRMVAKNEIESESRVNVNALAAITRLREAACAMPLVKNGWKEEPSKVSALLELVQEIVSGGNGVLVFSQFTGFLDIVSKALSENGIEHFYLNGATPAKKRQDMVADFQHGIRPVFLISLKAGGLGLNLTGANYVIHLDPWWNPAVEQQATDRAYRIGQKQNVTVYHLIAQGTIEEKILRMHKSKKNLADAVLEGTSSSHAITLDELRELLQ